MTTPIYIFYSLVSEDKTEGLKMKGPYIHSKPDGFDQSNESEEELYVFNKEQFAEERKFLSKYLRERSPDKLSIFYMVPVSSVSQVNLTCECGYKTPLPDGYYKQEWYCPSCGNINKINNHEELNFKSRKLGMMAAQDYFEKRYDQMLENFTICSRTRKKKK